MGKRTFMPHLHIHDEHSIKDGCSTVETYADLAVENGGDCLAITNHGQATGFARQYFACKDRGIKPIFGMEAYLNEYRHRPIKRLQEELKKADKATKKQPGANSRVKDKLVRLKTFIGERFRPSPHSIILARNLEGYRNLVRMSTDSFQNGFYYVPRTDTKFLIEHAEGLVYSTACIGGFFPRMARTNFDLACEQAAEFKAQLEANGGSFFVELMITEYEAQRETNEVMIRLASRIGAKCILTCDVHYAKPEDGQAQNVLLLMRDKKTIADKEAGEGVWQFEAKDLYWRTIQDVIECWKTHHGDYMDRECFAAALKNTLALADEIEDIEFDTSLKLPGVFTEPEHNLKELVKSGLRYRKEHGQLAPGVPVRDYVERIKRELGVINPKGFAEYFLILHDVCEHARKIGARMGPGRGSAGGSLVAYLCRITEIDPLRFSLLFERFLDAGRDDPPDIDLDFSPEHRDGVKAYVEETYPATATIGSNATFKPRATLQDVGRVFGIDYREMQKITKPLGTDADNMTWDQIFETWPAVQRFADDHPEAWSVVKVLRGLISHRGKNAAGMLIAPAGALDMVPMIVEKDGSGNPMTVTAFADSQGDGVLNKGREMTRLGYLKADFLGVRNLNIAPHAIEIVRRDTGQVIDLESLPLDDPETLATAATGDVPGAFQLDTSTTRPILRHVGVDSFADLVMITALARPGPLKKQVHREFANLKQSDAWEDEVLPELKSVLSDSRGLMILQEDVMWVVQIVCGLTMQEANALRKIMSKKHPEAMALWRDKFMAGGLEVGLATEEDLAELWEKIAAFADYGFNKAHSVAYMLTAYRQLYMLTHYAVEYFAALLTHTPRGKKTRSGGDQVVDFMRAAMARRLTIEGPCAATGGIEFDVTERGQLRYGLGHVKGIGGSAQLVVAARPFESLEELFDQVERRRVNSKVFTHLIYSGSLDSLEFNRHAGKGDPIPEFDGLERRNGIMMRYQQLRGSKDEVPAFTETVLREKERELLGLPLSWWSSPAIQELREAEGLETIDYHKRRDLSRVEILAEVSRARTHRTKKNTTMAFLTLADETGSLENVTIWPDQWKAHKRALAEGQMAIVRMRRRENHNREFGEWSYYLEDKYSDPVETVARALRRQYTDEPAGEEEETDDEE